MADRDYEKQMRWANELADELTLDYLIISLNFKRKPDLNAIFRKGPTTFASDCDGFWGDGKEYRKTFESPTWADMFHAADESIKVTRDRHHVFLEAVRYNRKTKCYEFSFGS
jgi:hypothetical protein